jgi:hypothetical protein
MVILVFVFPVFILLMEYVQTALRILDGMEQPAFVFQVIIYSRNLVFLAHQIQVGMEKLVNASMGGIKLMVAV